MVDTSNYLSNATKQQAQAHIDAVSTYLEHALHSAGEVAELGLTAAKESLNDSFAKFSEVIDSKDPAKVFEAFTLEVQPASEKVSAYAKHYVEIGTNAQNEVVKLIQERLDETVVHVNTLIDDLAKAAPAGSEPFAEMVKLQAANFHKAYEQFSSASHDLLGTYQSQLHNFASHFTNSAPSKPVKVKKLTVVKR
jgi:phasin family protein